MSSIYTTIFNQQRESFRREPYRSLSERSNDLKALREGLFRYQESIEKALENDFGKLRIETKITEILPTVSEISYALKNLKKWMRVKKVSSGFLLLGTKAEIIFQPKGVCLIISPWNYPLQLSLSPLVAALAAGNNAIIKPSEFTPQTNQVLKNLLQEIFPADKVSIIEGDAKTSQSLLSLPFDHIFFTGSTQIGKVVMEAAAKNLSSVTLELGGKSPVIIDESADLADAAEKILWAKLLNRGQTCVAPDHILLPENLLSAFKKSLEESYKKRFSQQTAWTCLIHQGHVQRLEKLEAGAHPQEQFSLGPLKILLNPNPASAVMSEEIFGPLLPIVTFQSWNLLMDHARSRPQPLAAYLFSNDPQHIRELQFQFQSGGLVINDLILHLGAHELPFGGVGPSGIGHYHGEYGFKAFSHEKAILHQKWGHRILRAFYPPYEKRQSRWVDMLIRFLRKF